MLCLADLYTFRRNPAAAVPWLRKLAANGDQEAIHDLPYALRNSGHLAEAEEFWLKRIEADMMREDAVHQLTDLYRWQGRDADCERLLQQLAEHGDEEAMWCLHLLLDGAGRIEESFGWRQRAADNGHYLALNLAVNRILHTKPSQADEQWLRRTILACRGAGLASCLLYALSETLGRAGKAEEAERLLKYGLEPDGSISGRWDLEI
jgi:TPR repeat protein